MFTIKKKLFKIWICLSALTVINLIDAVPFQNEMYDKTSELSYDFDTEQSKDRYDINILSKEIQKTPSSSSSYQEGAESCYTENHIKYKHGEKVIRSDPCEICLCMDGEIFCWWKKCNYRKFNDKRIMNKNHKNGKRKHRKRFDEHKTNKKFSKNFLQYYTLYSITRSDNHGTAYENNKTAMKNIKMINQQDKPQLKSDLILSDNGKKNWKKIIETTSIKPSLKMYNLSETGIFLNNDKMENMNNHHKENITDNQIFNNKVYNLNSKENILNDENKEFITMIHSNFNKEKKENNHDNDNENVSLNPEQKEKLLINKKQQLINVPMSKHYIITSSGNIENADITTEDITDDILSQYKNIYNKDKHNNDNYHNNNNLINDIGDNNKNDEDNNSNNLLMNRKDKNEQSKYFSSGSSSLLLSSSSSSSYSSPSQIIQQNKVTTTDQTIGQNCIVMGNTYKIGTILPQETGNCLQCICIEGANEGEPPRVTCSPHNCPPLILPDLFDTTGY